KTYPGARRADHLGKRLLTDFRNYRLRLPLLAEVCQQQEQTCQPFFAGIKELIDKVCFDAYAATQKMRNEFFRECWLLMNNLNNSRLLQSRDDRVSHSRDGRDPLCLPG